MSVVAVEAPTDGVWRVGRAPDPLALTSVPLSSSELDDPATGNRFDSATGAYRVVYFATQLRGCYGETLARFRPDPKVLAEIESEWRHLGFMVAEVPRDWRVRRVAVRVAFPPGGRFPNGVRFLDAEHPDTREFLRAELAPLLSYWGVEDLDVATVRGGDRRVTRQISQWAYDQRDDDDSFRFGGVRYMSRLDSDWECWTVFEDVNIKELERRSVLATDGDLRAIATRYRLTVH